MCHPGDTQGIRKLRTRRRVIVVELVGDRELRVETFPGLKPAEVEGFSSAALTYVR